MIKTVLIIDVLLLTLYLKITLLLLKHSHLNDQQFETILLHVYYHNIQLNHNYHSDLKYIKLRLSFSTEKNLTMK